MRIIYSFVMILFCTVVLAYPTGQPYAAYWFPNEILNWSPNSDSDAEFNRSTIPLRTRLDAGALVVNEHARAGEGKIANLYINGNTSNNPAQGYLDVNGPNFTYWQYIDRFVFWGGSAGEGLILAPSPDVVDAAHRNGVPVLGTVFFPPVAYGGDIQWVNDFLVREGDTFPVADKMIEVAEYFGFDGYFINQETHGGNTTTANDMRDWMLYFQANSDLELMWYDAMTESGSVYWQEALNAQNDMFFHYENQVVSESMFLDFGWSNTDIQNSRTNAQALGRSEYDLYAGIDVQANGYNTYANWSRIFPEDDAHVTSLGFYCPSWCYYSANDLEDHYERANTFWIGQSGDPSDTQNNGNWKGVAHYVAAESVIQNMPFSTCFNTGQGYQFYQDGNVVSDEAWYNRSTQDLLPTWRWLVEGNDMLSVSFDWTDAYYGGNCMKISGLSSGNDMVRLYKTNLELTSQTELSIRYQYALNETPPIEVALRFSPDGNYSYFSLDANTFDWQEQSIDLSSYSGETVYEIALYVTGSLTNDEIKIGSLAIQETEMPIPLQPTNFALIEKHEDQPDIASLRLRWNGVADEIRYYSIFQREGEDLYYLGSTSSNAYFVPKVTRRNTANNCEIVLKAIGLDFQESEDVSLFFDWEIDAVPSQASNPIPENGVNIIAANNVILQWTSGENTASHNLYFGTDENLEFLANTVDNSFALDSLALDQTYFWRIDEVNMMGETQGQLWSFNTPTSYEHNVAYGAIATASSDSGYNYSASKTIDGIIGVWDTGEWASNGELNPWLELTWEAEIPVHKIIIYDRVNPVDHAKDGIIQFSDGSEIEVQNVPDDGTAKVIEFDPVMTSSIHYQVANGVGSNVGLSEFEAYSLQAVDNGNQDVISSKVQLFQNYPNPFVLNANNRSQTVFSFSIPAKEKVELSIYNIRGQKVKILTSSYFEKGTHELYWDGKNESESTISSGVYLYKLKVGKKIQYRKFLIMK